VTQIAFMNIDVSTKTEEEPIQFTELVMEVSIEAIKMRVSRTNNGIVDTMIALELYSLTANCTSKTFGSSVDLKLGGVSLSADGQGYDKLDLVKTPMTEEALLHLHIFTVTI